MPTTLCFFNANNLFLRYRMGRKYPGDIGGTSYVPSRQWGFLPEYRAENFVPFRPEQTALTAQVLAAQGLPDILCLCEVESLLALRVFNERYLGGHYSRALLVDSRDLRQIDVGILTTKPRTSSACAATSTTATGPAASCSRATASS